MNFCQFPLAHPVRKIISFRFFSSTIAFCHMHSRSAFPKTEWEKCAICWVSHKLHFQTKNRLSSTTDNTLITIASAACYRKSSWFYSNSSLSQCVISFAHTRFPSLLLLSKPSDVMWCFAIAIALLLPYICLLLLAGWLCVRNAYTIFTSATGTGSTSSTRSVCMEWSTGLFG